MSPCLDSRGTRQGDGRGYLSWRHARLLLLVLVCASLLLPKLLLIDFYSELWIHPALTEFVAILSQDVILALAAFLAFRWLLHSASLMRVVHVAAVSTLLLAFLLIDVRVRELWLRPLDLGLVSYGWNNRSDLGSGLELFFNIKAGWGMTFRRSFALLIVSHVSLWGLYGWARLQSRPGHAVPDRRDRRWGYPTGLAAGLGGCALVVSVIGGQYRYGLQANSIVEPAIAILRSQPNDAIASSAAAFEQQPTPFRSTLTGPRRLLPNAKPYQRLVVVFLESFRWRDAELTKDNSPHPILRRMAREGLLSKSYAPVPHSSKGYFSVLSGRYPYPGIEMRESVALRHESFVHVLSAGLSADTYAFTSMHLAFENTGGLLRSLGFKHRHELKELLPPGVAIDAPVSSFGGGDPQLYEFAAQRLAQVSGPFVVALLPFGAHYPYEYPGKPPEEGATYQAYKRSLAETDRQLGQMLEHFEAHKLIDDTLFVLVGDHGEAFGEHGVFAHNSSVYEEEVAVPAIFWSADGRMQHGETLISRQIDLAPTVLDLFGYHEVDTPVQGVSLLRRECPPPVYFSTFFDNVALGLLEYPNKYVYEPANDHLLKFDLAEDPREAHGVLLREPERSALIGRMKAFQHYQQAAFPR